MDNQNLPSEQNERTERKFAEPAAHTPGPWHVSRGQLSGHVEIGVDDARDNFICTMHGVPPTDNEANAHLIAAAPDMLAALEQIVRYADSSTDPAIVKVARAAITKATGAA